jgi:hypothetical protein
MRPRLILALLAATPVLAAGWVSGAAAQPAQSLPVVSQAGSGQAQPLRQPLPPISAQALTSQSFDARAFDPLGMRPGPRGTEARAEMPVPAPQPGAALPPPADSQSMTVGLTQPVQEARADTGNLRRPGVGRDLLSDWWTRQQFGGLR